MLPSEVTVRLTTAQALVRHLAAQKVESEGGQQPIPACGGGFAIFGHGNVTGLGEALSGYRDVLPVWRGQNEQAMAMAATAYAKKMLRRRFMFATSSAGPGATNMVTAAGLAHTNRLPLLLLCGDAFVTRLPDPVLQQVEHFSEPGLSVTDAFKSVTRFWDRITHPAQILNAMPSAIDTLLDPADCGPVLLALPQDVQGWAYDYPVRFFEQRVHRIRRPVPDPRDVAEAAGLLRSAERPIIIAGGGVQYSCATGELAAFARKHAIPVVETIAGRANLLADDPMNCGPVGVTGSDSANALVAAADMVLAVGTRLQDFTTGSWTVFDRQARIIGVNVCRQDAAKHLAFQVVGDAKVALEQIRVGLADYRAPSAWEERARRETASWAAYVKANTKSDVPELSNRSPSYAQVIGAVNQACSSHDRIVASAGGLPAEIAANWQTRAIGSVDVEFGFSCMGYEIAGGWGARIAQSESEPEHDTIVMVGDGSYLMMNSDIYSSVLSGMKLIVIVCNNGGFAVIDKLQRNTGNLAYNNLIRDCHLGGEPVIVDFAAHAASMGALTEKVKSINEFDAAFRRAKAADRTYVIAIDVDPGRWTEKGHAWWEIGSAEVSETPSVRHARAAQEAGRRAQRAGV